MFNPSAAGTRTATMTFTSDDPATPSKVINLTGVGTNAIINASGAINFNGTGTISSPSDPANAGPAA